MVQQNYSDESTNDVEGEMRANPQVSAGRDDQSEPNDPKGITFLRLPQVKATTGLSKTSIYEKIKENAFPSPVPLGKRAVGWVASEITQWAANQVATAREERRHLDLRRMRRGPSGDYRTAGLRRSA